MENLKVKVNSESESKEAQELFFELGASWCFGCHINDNLPHDRSFILHNFGSQLFWAHTYESKNYDDAKEITIPQLQDMVVLNRNDPKDANYERPRDGMRYFVNSDKTRSYYMMDEEWTLTKWNEDQLHKQLKPIEKPMRETLNDKIASAEVARQEYKSTAWDAQVGGDHYKSMKIQPAQFALENKLDYCQANAIKYICRHQSKNGKQDLEKAKHYIDLLIEHYYGGEF